MSRAKPDDLVPINRAWLLGLLAELDRNRIARERTRALYAAPPDDLGLVRCFDCTLIGWQRDSNAPDGFAAYCRIASEVPDPIRSNQDLAAWRRCPRREKALAPRRPPERKRP